MNNYNYNNNVYGITKLCLDCFDKHQNAGLLCTSCLSKQNMLDKDSNNSSDELLKSLIIK
jgi:hypothetical protein